MKILTSVELEQRAEQTRVSRLESRKSRNLAVYDGSQHVIWLNWFGDKPDSDECKRLRLSDAYYVPCEEMDTPAGFVHWLLHLRDKTWFTAQVQDDFISCAVDAGIVHY